MINEPSYKTTKAECEARISGVCPGCGGPVTAIETVDNSGDPTFWSGCGQCFVFTEGYPLEVHQIAAKLVEEGTLIPYPNMYRDDSDNDEWLRWRRAQTRGAAQVVRRVLALVRAGDPQ